MPPNRLEPGLDYSRAHLGYDAETLRRIETTRTGAACSRAITAGGCLRGSGLEASRFEPLISTAREAESGGSMVTPRVAS